MNGVPNAVPNAVPNVVPNVVVNNRSLVVVNNVVKSNNRATKNGRLANKHAAENGKNGSLHGVTKIDVLQRMVL